MPRSPKNGTRRLSLISAWLIAGCSIETTGLGAFGSSEMPNLPDSNQELLDGAVEAEDAESELDAAVPALNGADAETACAAEGTFALRIDAKVHWEGTTAFGIIPIIVKGDGNFSISTYVDVAKKPKSLAATLRACGANIPDFGSVVNERYGVVIPDERWDRLSARWSTNVKRECPEPGCKYTSELLTAQIGINIPDRSVWPTPRDTLDPSKFADADGDGIPGLLLVTRGELDGPGYKHPPTSMFLTPLTPRIGELMLAIRVAASLDGAVESCDRNSGKAKDMVIETRALACRLDNGQLCTEDQLSFLDDNLPVWTVDDAEWHSIRVPSNPSCADVRALLQP